MNLVCRGKYVGQMTRISCILKGKIAICFLSADGFGEFLLGGFERKTQFYKYVLTIESKYCAKDSKILYFFLQETFCLV